MKITEETKLKDLIPDGHELNGTFGLDYTDGLKVTIPIKKKEVKGFKWYLSNYLTSKEYNTIKGIKISTKDYEDFSKTREGYFEHVSFEFKIGLLKFICDDCGVKWFNFAKYYALKEDLSKSFYQKVIDICPVEFLNSIFKQ